MPRWPKKDQEAVMTETRPDASVTDTPATEVAAYRPAPSKGPFLVKATMGGTYPDLGSTRAKWREVGDVFSCKCDGDFSFKWMQRVAADAEVAVAPKPVPQTTAKSRKPVPFHQL